MVIIPPVFETTYLNSKFMNQALAVVGKNTEISMPTSNEWAIMREQATMLVATNFLPQSIKTPEQAIAIMLQGRELGIPTMAALGTINVISGKPTVSPQLMLAMIERSGQLENLTIDDTTDPVTCTMKRRGRTAYTSRFGTKEATELGLIGKDNYKKQAVTMFKWRAVAACARVVFPDVVLGLYTPDEMGANMDGETGEIIAESAPVHSFPTKSQLTETARAVVESQPESKLNSPFATLPAFTEKETAQREEIRKMSERMGKPEDGQKAIAYFNDNPEMRELCVRRVRTAFVKYAIASEKWGLSESGTAEFLMNNGIQAIDSATDEALAQTVTNLFELEF